MKHIFIVFLFATVISPLTHAAPMPGTSTSKLVAPELGVFRSNLGFQISASGSGWQLADPPAGTKFVQAVYKEPNGQATLTVRVDRIEKGKPLSLEQYVQKWQKEYPRFGFDLRGSKAFAQNNARGFVMDLINRDTQKQMRQVIFVKDKRVAIMTCRDSRSDFENTRKSCNQIFKSFKWNE